MNIKQKVTVAVVALLVGAGLVTALSPAAIAKECGGATTSIIECEQKGGEGADPEDTGIWGLLILILNIMTAGVGILAVGGIVYGAILYTSASDSAEQTQQAKEIIRNVVIGIVAYGFMYVGLNFIIPGGIFGG